MHGSTGYLVYGIDIAAAVWEDMYGFLPSANRETRSKVDIYLSSEPRMMAT